jgi:hypothetical protein
MKRLSIILLGCAVLCFIILSACGSSGTYSDLLKEQKVAISNYISKNNIQVISTRPSDDGWSSNQYYLSSTGLYFNLSHKGNYTAATAADSIRIGDIVSVRYIQTSIDYPIDTVANAWTTVDSPYPGQLTFGVTSSGTIIATAWQEAISYMRYNGAEAQLIVPGSLGNSTAQSNVTPYYYKLKILKLPR